MIKNNIIEIVNDKLKNNISIYKDSFHEKDGKIFFLCKKGKEKFLGEINYNKSFTFTDLIGNIIDINSVNENLYIGLFNSSIENSKILASSFQNLSPQKADNRPSIGFGDRVGITGAIHSGLAKEYSVFPVLAQQSGREIEKTSSSCEAVIQNAVIGAFQSGFKGNWGADADHVRDEKWLKNMLGNGFLPYSMFTIDTYDYVYNNTEISNLDCRSDDKFIKRLKKANRFIGKSLNCFGYDFTYTENNINNIVKKYYRSLDFLLNCFNIIKEKLTEFDFEPTFDERDDIDTTIEELYYLASELIEDNISFSSFAPKFPGLFHKGIDYIGNVDEMEKYLKISKKISDYFGNFKISLHSADDKFKVFKLFRPIFENNFHMKFGGAPWMAVVKTIAQINPDLFKLILELSLEKIEENCKAYYICLDINNINKLIKRKNQIELVDIKDTRQLLHVSYGDILRKYNKEVLNTLIDNENKYAANVILDYKKHFSLIFS